jgi:hypothetical protein
MPDAPCRKGGVGRGVATTDSGIVFSQNVSGDLLVKGADTTAGPYSITRAAVTNTTAISLTGDEDVTIQMDEAGGGAAPLPPARTGVSRGQARLLRAALPMEELDHVSIVPCPDRPVHAGLGGCRSVCIDNWNLFGPVVVHTMIVSPIDPFEFAFEVSDA